MTPIEVLREFVADCDAAYRYGGTSGGEVTKDDFDWPDLRITYDHAVVVLREYDRHVRDLKQFEGS